MSSGESEQRVKVLFVCVRGVAWWGYLTNVWSPVLVSCGAVVGKGLNGPAATKGKRVLGLNGGCELGWSACLL